MHFQGTFFQIFPKMGKIYDNFAILGKKYALKGPILAFFPFPPFSFPFFPFFSIFFFFPFFFFYFFPHAWILYSPPGGYFFEYIYPWLYKYTCKVFTVKVRSIFTVLIPSVLKNNIWTFMSIANMNVTSVKKKV